jgi:hypothetical protein
MAEYQFPGRPEKLDRKVIITWPQPMAGTVRPWAVTITDADTGELISTVSKAVLEVHLDAADALTWAAVKAFAAEDGTLVTGSAGHKFATWPDGTPRARVFAFEVAEMRVAPPATLGGEATVHGFAPAGGRQIASGAGGHE